MSERASEAPRVVVVGYGMTAARLADRVRAIEPDPGRLALTVIGAEPHPAYNRVLLSAVLAGSHDLDTVALHGPEWAAEHAVDLRRGVAATGIDRERRTVALDDGSVVGYDTLVLATGAASWLPPTEGLLADDGSAAHGVLTFRTLDDCARILHGARPGAQVAVLGGGLLGLEAARGLVARGCRVTVVHPRESVMERQLDTGAGRVLAATLRSMGIEFRLGVPAERYLPGDGLKLADGTHVPAELVVVSAGVRPASGIAEAAGLAVDGGVVVDDALCTSDPRIRAIGDCASHPGTVSGLAAPGLEQAEVLARLLTGEDTGARYRGTPAVTRLKARGVDLVALGDVRPEPGGDPGDDPGGDPGEPEVLRFEDPARGRYAKLVLRGDRVTGAVLLGVPDAAAAITQLYDRGTPAPSDRLALLLGRALPAESSASPGNLPGSTVICNCNVVTKSTLVAAWRDGAREVAALAAATRATTGCGGCSGRVRDLVEWLDAAEPD